MKLSAAEEYGLRCLLHVARRELREPGEPVGIPEIAAAERLSLANTAKLMRMLRQGGIVESLRGARGGYRLSRRAEQISIWDAILALDGIPFSKGSCESMERKGRACVHQDDCSLRVIWSRLMLAVKDILQEMSLAELLQDEATLRAMVERSHGEPLPA